METKKRLFMFNEGNNYYYYSNNTLYTCTFKFDIQKMLKIDFPYVLPLDKLGFQCSSDELVYNYVAQKVTFSKSQYNGLMEQVTLGFACVFDEIYELSSATCRKVGKLDSAKVNTEPAFQLAGCGGILYVNYNNQICQVVFDKNYFQTRQTKICCLVEGFECKQLFSLNNQLIILDSLNQLYVLDNYNNPVQIGMPHCKYILLFASFIYIIFLNKQTDAEPQLSVLILRNNFPYLINLQNTIIQSIKKYDQQSFTLDKINRNNQQTIYQQNKGIYVLRDYVFVQMFNMQQQLFVTIHQEMVQRTKKKQINLMKIIKQIVNTLSKEGKEFENQLDFLNKYFLSQQDNYLSQSNYIKVAQSNQFLDQLVIDAYFWQDMFLQKLLKNHIQFYNIKITQLFIIVFLVNFEQYELLENIINQIELNIFQISSLLEQLQDYVFNSQNIEISTNLCSIFNLNSLLEQQNIEQVDLESLMIKQNKFIILLRYLDLQNISLTENIMNLQNEKEIQMLVNNLFGGKNNFQQLYNLKFSNSLTAQIITATLNFTKQLNKSTNIKQNFRCYFTEQNKRFSSANQKLQLNLNNTQIEYIRSNLQLQYQQQTDNHEDEQLESLGSNCEKLTSTFQQSD